MKRTGCHYACQVVTPGKRNWNVTRGRLGCLAVLLAMAAQLLFGGMMTAEPDRAERMALVSAGLLCSSSNVPPDGHRQHRHRGVDLALCPATMALELPASIMVPGPAMPPPAVAMLSRVYERPLLRGPPAIATRAGTPRGPPTAV